MLARELREARTEEARELWRGILEARAAYRQSCDRRNRILLTLFGACLVVAGLGHAIVVIVRLLQ